MTCTEARPLLNARLDNELDMAGATQIDLHLAECGVCAAQYAALAALHDEIAEADLVYSPAPAFERRVAGQFLKAPPVRWWTTGWATGLAAATALLVLVFIPLLRTNNAEDALGAEILDNHLRALQAVHQVDVPSSDQHTVKPWFQGKTSFSPPVPDLAKDDFVLIGGRLEVVHRQTAAAIVYRRRQHMIDLYVSPSPAADSTPQLTELGGYHLLHWTQENLNYWAVSDVDSGDLRRFADLIRGK